MRPVVYLDNAATTPMTERVKKVLFHHVEHTFGNPSSMHVHGREARIAIEDARKRIAQHFQCSIGEIFFTSGGTESNNTILQGCVHDLNVRTIITSRLEHPCVLEKIHDFGPDVKVEYVNFDPQGRAELEHLEALLKENKNSLVSLMHANNEMGSLNDLQAIGILCRKYGALFHSDTVQTAGYYRLNVNDLNIDFLSGSAHKFHGPKGVGFMFIRSDHTIQPLLFGGHQERNMRSGTENTPYIQAMAEALDEAYENLEEGRNHISNLRAYTVAQLQKECPEIQIMNPEGVQSHYKILNIALPLTERSSLALMNMDIGGICVSAGSACSSGAEKGSHVFDALFPGQDLKLIRLSFSKFNTKEDIDRAVKALKSISA